MKQIILIATFSIWAVCVSAQNIQITKKSETNVTPAKNAINAVNSSGEKPGIIPCKYQRTVGKESGKASGSTSGKVLMNEQEAKIAVKDSSTLKNPNQTKVQQQPGLEKRFLDIQREKEKRLRMNTEKIAHDSIH
ncbi:MAG: hypothetical protein HY738_11705 [Bacteroidia bacterium]|nr:hypothetical protein [Bacteroidia bacterium]